MEETPKKLSRRNFIAVTGVSVVVGGAAYGAVKLGGKSGKDEEIPDMSHLDEPDVSGEGDPDPEDVLQENEFEVEKAESLSGPTELGIESAKNLSPLNASAPPVDPEWAEESDEFYEETTEVDKLENEGN